MKKLLKKILFPIVTLSSLIAISCEHNLQATTIKEYSNQELDKNINILKIEQKYYLKRMTKFIHSVDDIDSLFENEKDENIVVFKQQYQKILESQFLEQHYLIAFNESFASGTSGPPIDWVTLEDDTIIINAIDRIAINNLQHASKNLSTLPAFIYVKKEAGKSYKKFKWNVIKSYKDYNDYRTKLMA